MLDGYIWVDVNIVWDVDVVVCVIIEFDVVVEGLEYVEQFCVSVVELVQVRCKVNVLVVVDELVCRVEDLFVVVCVGVVDFFIVKV